LQEYDKLANRLGTPLDTKPYMYFDPSDTTTQTVTAGRITSRTDVSGNNIVASCPETNNRPEPVSNGIGGLPSISYHGGQYDQAPISVTGNVFSALHVVQPQSCVNYARFMSYGSPPNTDYNDTRYFDIEMNNGNYQIKLNRNAVQSSLYSFTDNIPIIVEVVFDGFNAYFYVSGNLIYSFGSSDVFAITQAIFGQSAHKGDPFFGYQGGQVAYKSALNTADRQWNEGCLAWKWDGGKAGVLVGQLPSNHPNKTSPPMYRDTAINRRRTSILVCS
jgi:hypothetical protein